jgi:hypothetical protein
MCQVILIAKRFLFTAMIFAKPLARQAQVIVFQSLLLLIRLEKDSPHTSSLQRLMCHLQLSWLQRVVMDCAVQSLDVSMAMMCKQGIVILVSVS